MVQRPILGLLLTVTLITPRAWAESVESRQRTARTSCLSGDYAKGVAILSELFVDTRDPTYIYNQGRCFEQSRKYEDAIGRFQEYLRAGRSLSADEVADANKHIAECKQLLRESTTTSLPSAPPVTAEPDSPGPVGVVTSQPASPMEQPVASPTRPGRGLRAAGIVVGAAGVAGVVAGVMLSMKGNSLASDMDKLDGYTPERESSRKDYRNLGMVAYGVGAACIATGGVLYLLGLRAGAAEGPRGALAPILTPSGAGATITGAF
jgi:phage tail protein X